MASQSTGNQPIMASHWCFLILQIRTPIDFFVGCLSKICTISIPGVGYQPSPDAFLMMSQVKLH